MAPVATEVPCRGEPVLFSTSFESDLSLEDIAAAAAQSSLDDQIDEKDFIRRFISELSPREERIIRLRFGLDGLGEHSWQEVADQMSLTGARIRQIQEKALRKLRWRAVRVFPSRAMQQSVRITNRGGTLPTPNVSKQRAAPQSQGNLDCTGLSSSAHPDPADYANPADVATDQRRTKLYHEWIAERDSRRSPEGKGAASPGGDMSDRPNDAVTAYQYRLYLREMAATEAARQAGQQAGAVTAAASVQPEVSLAVTPRVIQAFDWRILLSDAVPTLFGAIFLFIAVTGHGSAALRGLFAASLIIPLKATAFLLAMASLPWALLATRTVRDWQRHRFQGQPKCRQAVPQSSYWAWTAALVAGLSASLFWHSQGPAGAELFMGVFGRASGLQIRALTYIAAILFGPISVVRFFEFTFGRESPVLGARMAISRGN